MFAHKFPWSSCTIARHPDAPTFFPGQFQNARGIPQVTTSSFWPEEAPLALIHMLTLSTQTTTHPHSCYSVFTHMATPVKRPLDAIDSRHRSRPLALP